MERECKDACFFALTPDGRQHRGCAGAEGITSVGVAFAELDEHDKKCKILGGVEGFESRQVCACNYDGCNKV